MNRRRTLLGLLVAGVALAGVTPASATADATSVRLAGTNRYATSHGVAASAWADRETTVAVLATGDSFADALAANYLAGALQSPILLNGRAAMDGGLPGALEEIGAGGVTVIGGQAAISDDVVLELQEAGFESSRLAGGDRFATARAIAELLPVEAVGLFGDLGRTAILVNGYGFADALAAGPMSYSQGWPILLTPQDTLDTDAAAAIDSLDIQHVIIVGGTAAVSDDIATVLEALDLTVQRIAGEDRTITAQAVANFLVADLGYGGDDVVLARGDAFPDALSAGPRGGDELMPILLTPSSTDLGAAAAAFITEHKDQLDRIEVFGGTAAISEGVEDLAVSLARS